MVSVFLAGLEDLVDCFSSTILFVFFPFFAGFDSPFVNTEVIRGMEFLGAVKVGKEVEVVVCVVEGEGVD